MFIGKKKKASKNPLYIKQRENRKGTEKRKHQVCVVMADKR